MPQDLVATDAQPHPPRDITSEVIKTSDYSIDDLLLPDLRLGDFPDCSYDELVIKTSEHGSELGNISLELDGFPAPANGVTRYHTEVS